MVHTDVGTGTTATGTYSKNVISGNNVLSQIFVKPATAGTTFDIKLVDIYNNEMFLREDLTGELNETSINMPTYGNYTSLYTMQVQMNYFILILSLKKASMFIKLRKKYLLPSRWSAKREREINKIGVRTKDELYEKLRLDREELLLHQRLNNPEEIKIQEGKIQILKWLIYGDTEI